MAVSVRPFATAGVALAAASVLTIVPSAPPALLAAAPPPASSTPVSPAFKLTSAVDPFLAWVELFNTTQINYAAIVNEWNDAPVPVLQQLLVNWAGFVDDVTGFCSWRSVLICLGEILELIVANGTAAADALVAANPSETLDALHQGIFSAVQVQVPADLLPVVDYTSTFSSGIAMGMLGAFISPWLAFGDSVDDIVNYLFVEPDVGKALNTFLNIPADWLNGFFNGYDGIVDLSFLIPLLPEISGVTIEELGLVLGGLFSPAGALFSGVNAEVGIGICPGKLCTQLSIPGVRVGPLASWIAQGKVQAEALGWSGTGNPVTALLPGEEEAAVEETPAEEAVAEETPAEEAVVEEEAAVEEAAAEETPAEEAVADEAADDSSSGAGEVSDSDSGADSGADSGEGDADAA